MPATKKELLKTCNNLVGKVEGEITVRHTDAKQTIVQKFNFTKDGYKAIEEPKITPIKKYEG